MNLRVARPRSERILAAYESRYRGTRILGEPGLNLTGFLSRKKVIEATKPRQMAIQVRPAARFFASICARKADHACELRIPKLLLKFSPRIFVEALSHKSVRVKDGGSRS